MFVKILTPDKERFFDCDDVAVNYPIEDTENVKPVAVEIFKSGVKVKEIIVPRLKDHSVFFMNDQGRTIDRMSWHIDSK